MVAIGCGRNKRSAKSSGVLILARLWRKVSADWGSDGAGIGNTYVLCPMVRGNSRHSGGAGTGSAIATDVPASTAKFFRGVYWSTAATLAGQAAGQLVRTNGSISIFYAHAHGRFVIGGALDRFGFSKCVVGFSSFWAVNPIFAC